MQYIVLLLLFGIPLLANPFMPLGFETPKVIVSEILIGVLLISFIPRLKSTFFSRFDKKFILLLLGLFGISVIHLFTSLNPQIFFGNVIRLQGAYLLWHLLVFSIISSLVSINEKNLRKASFWSLCILAVSSLILWHPILKRSIGLIGEPNALASVAVFLLPLTFYSKNIMQRSIAITLAAIIVMTSGSQSGILAFFILLIFLFCHWKLKFSLIRSTIICSIFIVISLFFPYLEHLAVNREGFYFFENRFEVWQTAFLAGLNAPLFGHGFGTISDVLKQTALQLSNNLRFQVVDSSHNIILDYWVQGGITATTILFLLIFGTIIGLTKKHKVLELAAFLAVSTTLLFNPASISSLIAFWWLIGQAFTNAPTGDPTRTRPGTVLRYLDKPI